MSDDTVLKVIDSDDEPLEDVSEEDMSEVQAVLFDSNPNGFGKDRTTGIIEKSVGNRVDVMELSIEELNGGVNLNIIPPLYKPLSLMLLAEENTRLSRAIIIRSRATVGLGWFLERAAGYKDMSDKEFATETSKLRNVLDHPNFDNSFSELNTLAKMDEETTGNGFIEVIRQGNGDITGFEVVPSHTIRVVIMKDKDGVPIGKPIYLHSRNGNKVYYKSLGDARKVSKKNGEINANLAFKNRASELIHYLINSPRSSYYGSPRWIPATPSIIGNRLVGVRNLAFFENDAVGRLAIIVEGGSLSKETIDHITKFTKGQAKGPEKAHRLMVLEAQPKKTVGGKISETRIRLEPLTLGINDDASFQKYRMLNDEEVSEVSGLSAPFFANSSMNAATASMQRQITNELELIPDLKRHEYIWNANIVPTFTKVANLRFVRPDSVSKAEAINLDGTQTKIGMMSLNETRINMGRKPYDKKVMPHGDKPLPFALVAAQAEVAQLAAGLNQSANPTRSAQEIGNAGQPGAKTQTSTKCTILEDVMQYVNGIDSIVASDGGVIKKVILEKIDGTEEVLNF